MTEDGGPAPAVKAKSDYKPPAGVVKVMSWTAGERTVAYTATAGWTVLRKDDQPVAEIFSVAYIAPAERDEQRPVTFVFNGGPGASSAYLHMGAVGPTRVAFPPDGTLPRMPPRLVTNEESWLPFTDLVFVDPVGTGFSRVIPPDGDKDKAKADDDPAAEYFGYKKDLESLCEFMSRWLSSNNRWGSPILIAGESYGGYRVGRLVRMAQEHTGIGFSGAILISPAMEIAGLDPNDYDVLAWVDLVPTMALAAVHHGRSRAFGADSSSEEVIAAAAEFATGDLATLLTRGASMPAADRERIFARQADLIGLAPEFVARAEGRINIETFMRELLRDERKIVGLYDATVTSVDPFPDRSGFEGADPTLAGSTPAFTAAVNRQLRGVIGVETDREYLLISFDVFHKWKNDAPEHFFTPPLGATDDFRYGMSLNPHMKAFITHGRYDLVTPFYTSERLVNLMRLDPDTASRLTVEHFGGGHMFYAWEDSRRAFTAAIRDFYGGAVPSAD